MFFWKKKLAPSPLVRIFSFALASPKPLHGEVLRNWALAPSNFRFSLITDCPELWRPLIPKGAKIDIVTISIDEWFDKVGLALSSSPESAYFAELLKEKFAGKVNGWTACSLRPLLPHVFDLSEADVWGWIDWDVLIDPEEVAKHVAGSSSDLMMFPPDGYMWEHFKLFRRSVDLLPLSRKLLETGQAGPVAPLCAISSYAIGAEQLSRDGISQYKIAVHWAYTDRLKAANGFDVVEKRGARLFSETGRRLMFFVADTQVKDWSPQDVTNYVSEMTSRGEYHFRYVPKLA